MRQNLDTFCNNSSEKHIPQVSIGMPVYNGEKYLREALDSLLAQTFDDFELIISDNSSTDGTADICMVYASRDKRIKYHRQPENRGVIANAEFVIKSAVGKYFMLVGDDDVYDKEYIRELINVLETDNRVGLVFSRFGYIYSDGSTTLVDTSLKYKQSDSKLIGLLQFLLKRSCLPIIFGLARRELFVSALPFRYQELAPLTGDVDNIFLFGLLSRMKAVNIDSTYFFYRQKNRDQWNPSNWPASRFKKWLYLLPHNIKVSQEMQKVVWQSDLLLPIKFLVCGGIWAANFGHFLKFGFSNMKTLPLIAKIKKLMDSPEALIERLFYVIISLFKKSHIRHQIQEAYHKSNCAAHLKLKHIGSASVRKNNESFLYYSWACAYVRLASNLTFEILKEQGHKELGAIPLNQNDILIECDTTRGYCNWVYLFGVDDAVLFKFYETLLKNGDVVIDVGANEGVHSLVCGKIVGENGAVVAYEPHPKHIERINANLELNSLANIKIREYAVGEKSGIIPFTFLETGNTGLSRIDPNSKTFAKQVSLDSDLNNLALRRIDLIKIDVEGMELSVLAGAKETIHRFRPVVVIEFNRNAYCLDQIRSLLPSDYLIFCKPSALSKPWKIVDTKKKERQFPDTWDIICVGSFEAKKLEILLSI